MEIMTLTIVSNVFGECHASLTLETLFRRLWKSRRIVPGTKCKIVRPYPTSPYFSSGSQGSLLGLPHPPLLYVQPCDINELCLALKIAKEKIDPFPLFQYVSSAMLFSDILWLLEGGGAIYDRVWNCWLFFYIFIRITEVYA